MTELDTQKMLLFDTVFTFGYISHIEDNIDIQIMKEIIYAMALGLGVEPSEVVWWERLGSAQLP